MGGGCVPTGLPKILFFLGLNCSMAKIRRVNTLQAIVAYNLDDSASSRVMN